MHPTIPPAPVRAVRGLVAFLDESRSQNPGWFNAPVPSFGELEARLLIVGLAPGLRGQTAQDVRFTGDFAGEITIQLSSHMASHMDLARAHLMDYSLGMCVSAMP